MNAAAGNWKSASPGTGDAVRFRTRLISATVAASTLAACGGSGGGSAPAPVPVPATLATAAASTNVAGSISLVAGDGITLSPLVRATVVIGPVPVTGATAPASVPPGDVVAITDATGTFGAALGVAPAAPSAIEPFVIPANNALAFVPPVAGYYVEVFGEHADGASAGIAIPLHRFVAASGADDVTRVGSVGCRSCSVGCDQCRSRGERSDHANV